MFLGLLKKIVFIAIITVNIGVCADQTTIEADNINKINNNIEAKGNVVIQKDKYTLSTDKILYNRVGDSCFKILFFLGKFMRF